MTAKESASYTQRNIDWPLFFARSARTCNRRCLHSSMIGMLCTAFLDPSRANQIIRCSLPELFSFDFGLNRLLAWFCRGSWLKTCRSGWFSIFWIISRTFVLCACITTACGNPGIRKSIFFSFSIASSWLEWSLLKQRFTTFYHEVCHFQRWMLLFHEKNVFENYLAHFSVFVSTASLLVLSCVVPTLGSLLSSDERAWIALVATTGLSILCEETNSSWKELTSVSWERDVFHPSCTVLVSSLTTGLTVLSRLGFRIGLFDWKLLDSYSTSDRWTCSELISLFHSCFKEIFGGGRGHMYTFSCVTSPVSILTTFGIQ